MVCLSCTATGERVCLAAEGFGNRHCFLENIADKNVPPDLSQCVFVIEQALSVRALQELVTAAGSETVRKWMIYLCLFLCFILFIYLITTLPIYITTYTSFPKHIWAIKIIRENSLRAIIKFFALYIYIHMYISKQIKFSPHVFSFCFYEICNFMGCKLFCVYLYTCHICIIVSILY